MRIAITAGASQLAQDLAKIYSEKGHQVFVIDDLKNRTAQNIKYGQLILRGLDEVGPLEMAFKKEQIDAVFHLEKFPDTLVESIPQQEYLFSRTLGLLKIADKLKFKFFAYSLSPAGPQGELETLVLEMLKNIRCTSQIEIICSNEESLSSLI